MHVYCTILCMTTAGGERDVRPATRARESELGGFSCARMRTALASSLLVGRADPERLQRKVETLAASLGRESHSEPCEHRS